MAGMKASLPVAEQAEYWVVRLASGGMTEQEMLAFEDWLAFSEQNRAAFDSIRAMWTALEPSVSTVAPLRRRVPAIGRKTLGVAAVAACLAVISFWPAAVIALRATQATATGEIASFVLPDGSRAMLDSGSAIAVSYDTGERHVALLRGRGWFDVRHGDPRPFRVVAAEGVTQDIGTAFEVSLKPDGADVTVTDGAVQVRSGGDAQPLFLRRSEGAHYDTKGPVSRLPQVPGDVAASWRRGQIVIDSQPVSEAVKAVARYRKGLVLMQPGLSLQVSISGIFRTDDPDAALDVIAQMAGLRIIRLPGGLALFMK